MHLAEPLRRIAELRQNLDSPLLVAVMGEFNAGKSTFINALLELDIPPMDVVPITAMINVLSYRYAVPRPGLPVSANPTWQLSLRMEAIGAIVEAMKRLKPSVQRII